MSIIIDLLIKDLLLSATPNLKVLKYIQTSTVCTQVLATTTVLKCLLYEATIKDLLLSATPKLKVLKYLRSRTCWY
jgi:hypothetical protein